MCLQVFGFIASFLMAVNLWTSYSVSCGPHQTGMSHPSSALQTPRPYLDVHNSDGETCMWTWLLFRVDNSSYLTMSLECETHTVRQSCYWHQWGILRVITVLISGLKDFSLRCFSHVSHMHMLKTMFTSLSPSLIPLYVLHTSFLPPGAAV